MTKVVLITGASRGIGRATARLLGARGWSVGVNYAHNEAAARETAAEVGRAGGHARVIPGDVADESAVIAMFDSLVHAFGRIDAVAPLLASADLFLLPSQSESFGLSALEALACGVPVVASRVGGLPEVVDDGVTGVLCDFGDVDAMAAASIRILRDRDRWQAMSAAAAADARARFSESDIVARYEAFYARTLG